MSAIATSPRSSRITVTYETIRELIVSGRLAPGSRIIENTLAERLHVSRTPVRGALQRLQQEGYVQASDGGKQARLTVAPLTRDDGSELFWIVGELEAMAVYWMAMRDAAARHAVVGALREVNDGLRAAAEEATLNPRRIFDLHTRFHQCCVEGASGPRLLALHASIRPQAERYRRLYSTARGGEIHESLAEHEVIIRCIEGGDAEGAERAVRANWRNAAERLAQMIDAVGERGSW
jgi:DNA-binding GntR family transcriptional regulator